MIDYEKKYGGRESLYLAMVEGRVAVSDVNRAWASHANPPFMEWIKSNGLDNRIEEIMEKNRVNPSIVNFFTYCLSQLRPMRLGALLPTYIPDEERGRWAAASFETLAKTATDSFEEKPILMIIPKGERSQNLVAKHSFKSFDLTVVPQPSEVKSNDGCLVWGWDELVKLPGITHLCFLTDDWLYNPRWTSELKGLIERKPGAKAWWVYRSTYEEIHKTLKEEPDAVLVKSINAGGCVSVQEHREWKMDWRKCPRENGENGRLSLDLLHPRERPGDRWVTPQSYILNIGLRGACQRPEINDFARDFVGLE